MSHERGPTDDGVDDIGRASVVTGCCAGELYELMGRMEALLGLSD